jgi:DNA-binding CsgD family transcriptional regulator
MDFSRQYTQDTSVKALSNITQSIKEIFKGNGQDHWVMVFLLFVVIASGADLAADVSHGAAAGHVLQEAGIMFIAFFGFCWMLFSLVRSNNEIKELYQELDSIKSMPQPSSQQMIDAKRRLGEVILLQFAEWKLSKSEQEIGHLLLKGFSLKEISTLRGTAEKTIRQQASSIYKKAGVAGRHVFSAWFIEDLL